jgi:hypothetical protein
MAMSPLWKVYRADGEYIASVRSPEYGAMILASLDETGATIRRGHSSARAAYFTEGKDGHAAESYDAVAKICYARSRQAKEGRLTIA